MSTLRQLLFSNQGNRQIFLKNSFWRFAGVLPSKLLRFFIILLAAKQLGPESFGVYNYAVALVSMAFIVSDWGINILLIRDYQHFEDKNKIVTTSFVAKISILFISTIVALGILFVSGSSLSLFGIGAIIALTFFVGHVKELFSAIFLAMQKAEFEARVYFIETILSIPFFYFLFFKSPSAFNLAFFYLLVSTATMVASWYFASKWIKFSFKSFDKTLLIELLKNGFVLSLFGILGYIFFSTDQLFLKYFHGYEEVGYYALATKIVLTLQIFPSLINSVVLPMLSQRINDKPRLKFLVARGLVAYAIAGALISLAIIILIKYFIFFFGAQYAPSASIIKLLSPILIFMFMVSLLDHVLISFNRQKQDFYLTLLAAIANLILCILLIPSFGMYGAVGASLISQAFNFVLTGGYVFKLLRQ
ncbi:flippase [Candidatus Parcubacteria bacterium]|nr:flippase [Patescibacteria group bacterium]MBU4309258.1 flippase [Patescibacteria group bacterium]MBU4432487.1 flippase [Patescibacteria group bacterium]MBU4577619.1 flippase [Patescibacteria group bacterium]MCG2697306.1 flippase [Candidatus Parcubacteria bacterium]